MKKLTALLSVLVMLFLCVLSVSAAEDYIMYDLADSATAQKVYDKILAGKDNASITEDGILADGALVAAEYLIGKPAGIYNMKDIIGK